MADFDSGDVTRLGCVMQLDGQYDIVNVLYVKQVAGASLDFAAAGQDFGEYCDALYARIAARQTDLLTEKHISIKNMTKGTVWGNIAWPTYVGGTQIAEATAPQVALLGFARTPLSRVQIRKYLGVFTEADMTDGIWGATVRGACDLFMSDHITPMVLTNGLRLQGIAYRISDGRVTDAISVSTSLNPVIQRRRRRGRGS